MNHDVRPQISICIPTFNGSPTILETIQSVLSQEVDLEVVVSDGGSSDDTVALVRSINDERVKVHTSIQRLSPAENWNRSVEFSTAKITKVMGQDDLLLEGSLARELSILNDPNYHSAPFVFSRRAILIGGRLRRGLARGFGESTCVVDPQTIVREIVGSGRNPIGEPVAVTFRRELFDRAGGFRGDYVIDLSLIIRLLDFGAPVWLPETLSAYRVFKGSWSTALYRRQSAAILELHQEIKMSEKWEVPRATYFMGRVRAYVIPLLRKLYIAFGDRN